MSKQETQPQLLQQPHSLQSISKPEIDIDDLRNERLHLTPLNRLQALASTSAIIGSMLGFYEGVQKSAARYLVENAHRLPTTKGGWYFYHKRKNYEMIVGGMTGGVKTGLKFGGFVAALSFFESSLDYGRGQIDFINTTLACFVGTGLYTRYKQLSVSQASKMIRKGTIVGLMLGVAQDMMIYARGGKVWYLDEVKKRLH